MTMNFAEPPDGSQLVMETDAGIYTIERDDELAQHLDAPEGWRWFVGDDRDPVPWAEGILDDAVELFTLCPYTGPPSGAAPPALFLAA